MTDGSETWATINLDEALKFTGGDREGLVDIARMFLVEGPKQLQVVQESVEAGDADRIRKGAHSLKGSVVIFGAQRVAAAAVMVQNVALDEDLSGVPSALKLLEREMEQLVREVQQLCEG